MPRIKKPERTKTSDRAAAAGLGGVLGTKRLSDTLGALTGDDLPERGEALTTETTVLLLVVAAVILYFLMFRGRGEGEYGNA